MIAHHPVDLHVYDGVTQYRLGARKTQQPDVIVLVEGFDGSPIFTLLGDAYAAVWSWHCLVDIGDGIDMGSD